MYDQPTPRPVSPLRRRMLEDMAMRGLREATQRDYLRFVSGFATFLGRAPDTASAEDIRRFQVHQTESGVQPPTINASVSALRFLFTVTLDRPDLSRRFILVRHPRRLPDVLSVEEVGRLLEAAPGPKHKAALGAAYGAGLRVSEVAALKTRCARSAGRGRTSRASASASQETGIEGPENSQGRTALRSREAPELFEEGRFEICPSEVLSSLHCIRCQVV